MRANPWPLVLTLLHPRYWVTGLSVAALLTLVAKPLLAQENSPSGSEEPVILQSRRML
jgi:hypothetical protein